MQAGLSPLLPPKEMNAEVKESEQDRFQEQMARIIWVPPFSRLMQHENTPSSRA